MVTLSLWKILWSWIVEEEYWILVFSMNAKYNKCYVVANQSYRIKDMIRAKIILRKLYYTTI